MPLQAREKGQTGNGAYFQIKGKKEELRSKTKQGKVLHLSS
jgi:hypothetical protein